MLLSRVGATIQYIVFFFERVTKKKVGLFKEPESERGGKTAAAVVAGIALSTEKVPVRVQKTSRNPKIPCSVTLFTQ